MKNTRLTRILAMALFALALPITMTAQKHHQYKVVDLGTFGGPGSAVYTFQHALSARGAVVGGADTPDANPNPGCFNFFIGDCNVNHAFQWRHGVLTDLGTLPGGVNSFAYGVNSRGWVVGGSENGTTDPVLGTPGFDAVLWRNGQTQNLGTLGGNESLASDVNHGGQIVGFAANAVPDPVSMVGWATQTRPFLYEHGVMRDLDTLGGTDGMAFLTNERGQIMGQFYVQGTTTIDSIFWDEDGTATDIGSLGGTNSNCGQQSCGPYWINNRGQVVGNSTLAGEAVHHGFLWDWGTLTDLGTLGGDSSDANSINDSGVVVGRADVPGSLTHHGILWTPKHGVMTTTDLGVIGGDACSTAYSINSGGQIVGDAGICFVGGRAWLWENGGPMVDLNDLALPGSGLHLQDARLINDRGEIVCTGVLPNGDVHAVLLVPVDGVENANSGAVATPSLSPRYVPSGTQHPPQSRWSNRYQMPGLQSPSR
jgi:probable HAF family extracellular repeat protein